MEPLVITWINLVLWESRDPRSKVRAFVHVVLNEAFRINGITVIAGDNGLFVSWPRNLERNRFRYHVICSPTGPTHEALDAVILEEYNKLLAEVQEKAVAA